MAIIHRRPRAVMYDHDQPGHVLQFVVFLSLLLVFIATVANITQGQAVPNVAQSLVFTILLAFLAFLMISLGSLRVRVYAQEVRVNFKLGWPSRHIPVARIDSVRPVKNTPLQGWGVRYIGKGWMYNVGGLDAVELRLKNGKRFRIGTDDPERLADVIESRLHDNAIGPC